MTRDVVLLSLGWGCAAAAPLVALGTRAAARDRAGGLRSEPRRDGVHGFRRSVGAWIVRRADVLPGVALATRVVRGARLQRRARREAAALAAELPVAIDLCGVAVGAGCTPYLALEIAATWAPPLVAQHLREVPEACRLGAGLADALLAAGRATPALRPLTDALCATVRLGAPVGPVLARLAEEARAEMRRAAETRARTVSVRLLFPLVLCVLPAFGLLTIVPAVIAGLRPG